MDALQAPASVQAALVALLDACNAKGHLAAQLAAQEQFVTEQWAAAYHSAYADERTASGRHDLANAAVSTVRREQSRLRGELTACEARIHFLTVYIQAGTHNG